jgi:hypothetical protein
MFGTTPAIEGKKVTCDRSYNNISIIQQYNDSFRLFWAFVLPMRSWQTVIQMPQVVFPEHGVDLGPPQDNIGPVSQLVIRPDGVSSLANGLFVV